MYLQTNFQVFKIVFYDHIYPFVSHQISSSQHGFFKHRSTITNLAIITQYVSEHLDTQGHADVIYTDFSAAFDSINYAIFLTTLGM